MTNRIDEAQFNRVADLLVRQDEALEQLDSLCRRVEQAIEEITGTHENESAADEATKPADTAAPEQPEHDRRAA